MSEDRPLRVAVLVKRYVFTGGSERYAVELTRRLVQRGFVVDLFCREHDPDLVQEINSVIKVPDRGGFSSIASAMAFAKDCKLLLQNHNYDVIHSHERGYSQDILTVHTFTWKAGTRAFQPIKRFFRYWITPRHHLYSWLEKRQMQTPHLVAVSNIIAKDIADNYPTSGQSHVISPGVDVEIFTPKYIQTHRSESRQSAGLPDKAFVVLFVGNEFRRKGLDDLIPALGDGMVLLVAGQGERLEHYLYLAKDHGVADRVRFLGLVTDVRPLYAMADVVVLPSLREGFGMVMLETMACGLPVIVRDSVGAAGLVNHGVNGLRFSQQSELKSLLAELAVDSELQLKISRSARLTAQQQTWDHIADKYADLYRFVAAAKTIT